MVSHTFGLFLQDKWIDADKLISGAEIGTLGVTSGTVTVRYYTSNLIRKIPFYRLLIYRMGLNEWT